MVRCQDIGNPKLTIQGDPESQGKYMGLREGMDKPRLIYHKISVFYGAIFFFFSFEPSPRQAAGNVLPVTALLRGTVRIKK